MVMPFFEHDSFRDYVKILTIDEIQVYMKSLFSALMTVHDHCIIHRDVKPSNVLFNYKNKTLKLIDFGLSQKDAISVNNQRNISSKHCDHKVTEICNLCKSKADQITSRAGTSGYRAFEVLLKYQNQSAAVDIWSAGIILLCFLSGTYPFFKPKNDIAAILQIASLFGSQKCTKAAMLLGKEFFCSPCMPTNLSTICQQLRSTHLSTHFDGSSGANEHPNNSNWIIAPPAAYELLELCLDLNPHKRISAYHAINHKFFH